MDYAQQNGLRLLDIGATRPICPACAARIDRADVNAALQTLREGVASDATLRDRLAALSARFDEECLPLDEEGDAARKPEVLRLFGKARGASALAFALSDDASGLHEAIYEAMSAIVEDPSKVARAVEAALRAGGPN